MKRILVSCFVFFLLILSCCVSQQEEVNVPVIKTPAEFCGQVLDDWTRGECLAIIGAESESYCESTYPGLLMGQCYIDFAVAREDPSICEKASGTRDSCILAVSIESQDSGLCYKITDTDSRSVCFRDIAQDTGDYSLCEIIPNQDIMTQCLAESPQSMAGCENKTTDYCLLNKAVTQNKPALCIAVNDTGMRNRCLTLSATSASLCEGIPPGDARDFCLGVAAEKTRDESACTLVSDNTRRDECYFYAAKAKNDPGLCELISPTASDTSNSKKNYCYYHLGIINKDAGVCNKVRQTSFVARQSDLCYYHAALRLSGLDRIKSYSIT